MAVSHLENVDVKTGRQTFDTYRSMNVEDWSKGICDLYPEDTDFYWMSTKGEGKVIPTKNRYFKWIEYMEDAPKISLLSGVFVTGGKLQLPTDRSLHGMVKDTIIWVGNDYCRVVETPSVVSVSGVDRHEITLRKIVFPSGADMATSETPIVAGDLSSWLALPQSKRNMKVMYISKPAGTDESNPVKRLVDSLGNTITTIEHDVEIDFHTAADEWRPGMSKREWQISKMGLTVAKDMERALLLGVGYDGYYLGGKYSGHDLQMTKGLYNFPGLMRMSAPLSSFGYLDFCEYTRDFATKFNKKKVLTGFCNKNFISRMHEAIYNDSRLHTYFDFKGKADSEKIGMNIKSIVTPSCEIQLRENTCLNENFDDDAILMTTDMSKISVRCLINNGENFTMALYKDVQGKKAKWHCDSFYGAIGLQVENAPCHSILRLTA
jgi:hypothetical protein